MENKAEFQTLHRVFIALAFLTIFIAHAVTVQPSVPFWDCGERLCAMTWQQVPHPPGTPFFAMLGRIFQIIIPFGDLGWRGNMVSVAASGVVVALLYMIIVIVIKNLRKKSIETFGDAISVYGAALIGALGFGFSGTFWFNSVEAETYTTAILVVTMVMYLMMRWTQVADEKDNERYILLSIYLVGISMGIHQLSLLVIFTIILTVYFRKYPITPKTFLALTVIGLGIFFFVFQMIVLSLPAWLAGRTAHRNEALEFAISNSGALQFVTVAGIIGLCYLFYWSYKNKKSILALSSFALISIVFSFTIYLHVVIRAGANPPMNENEPKNFGVLASYTGREQYGSAPMWPRRYQTEDYFVANHNKQDKSGNYVYGQWNPPGRKPVTRKDGSMIAADDWNNVNTSGELAYLWKYQMNQMYFRYLFWNYVGRLSDVQDAGVAWFDTQGSEELNYKSGFAHLFPVRYFALPLLFGLIGLYYQFKKDYKMGLIFLATFLVMGVLTAMYQNQQEPQPRERDYFYMGSFMVWGLWIGMGAYALIDWLNKEKKNTIIATVLLLISFIFVPLNLAMSNVKIYSRAGNFLPFDYAYNLLQSVEKDAIIFTNGDNDTFCVWFMQDVEGVRRDVRICNLSLGNTLWYVDQLKNRNPWGAKELPLSFPNEMLRVDDEYEDECLRYEFGEAKVDRIQVKKEILAQFTNDPAIINEGAVTFTFIGKQVRQDENGKPIYLHRVQDKLVRDIIVQTKFERPIYYSNSVGSDAQCGLSQYFRNEGLCYRICPVAQQTVDGNSSYNEEVMDKILLNIDNSNDFSKTPKYGLKLRGLNDPNVYFDETARRTILMAYPAMFIYYANYLATVKNNHKKAEQILDQFCKYIPDKKFPLRLEVEHQISQIYSLCGNKNKAEEFALKGIKSCEEQIANENLDPDALQYEQLGRHYGPFQRSADLYKIVGEWEKAKNSLEKLASRMQSIKAQMEAGGAAEEAARIGGNISALNLAAQQIAVDKLESENKFDEAIAELKKIEENLANSKDPYAQYFMGSITARRNELETKLGLPNSTKTDSMIAQQ